MASAQVDTLQVSYANILKNNKTELTQWLSSDLHILQHAHSKGIIDDRLYRKLMDKEQREDACILLIDTLISRGEGASSEFLTLLQNPEIVDTYPQLRKWNRSLPDIVPGGAVSVQRDDTSGEGASKERPRLEPASDIVTEKQLLQVASRIGTAWRRIGISLGISEVKLQQIEKDNPQDHVGRVYQMLFLWRKQERRNATAVNLHTKLTELDADLIPDDIDFLVGEGQLEPTATDSPSVGGPPELKTTDSPSVGGPPQQEVLHQPETSSSFRVPGPPAPKTTVGGPPEQQDVSGSTGSNERKRKTDDSPSTIPRQWHQVSKRWRPQLEKLVNMDDSQVKKVDNLVLGKGKDFSIAVGSNGVEVYLGLRDDGTEVAVKKMSTINKLYEDLKNDKLYLRLPELDDPSFVRYVDFKEKKNYGYLALQLCEYTLEEYITDKERKLSEEERKRLAKQFLNSLRILQRQDIKIIHRDLKPRNVLIDIQGKARLADFGISRRIEPGKSTHHTGVAGTSFWMAKETLKKTDAGYKRSTDIQVAGMLTYYILSGGHHPFVDDINKATELEYYTNISEGKSNMKHLDDNLAKDLVEWMIHGEPTSRPTAEQCLSHPFFWPDTWRVEYLRRIGNEEEVEKYRTADPDLMAALDQYAVQGQFNAWKQKFRDADEETRKVFETMDGHNKKKGEKFYVENSFGLLRFIRNLHAHYASDAAGIKLLEMFPGLFWYVYKFAKEQEPDWNSRPALKDMFDFCPRCAISS